MSREQKLVDLCFEFAMTGANKMHGKTNQEIADWVADQLRGCGFQTVPRGLSWGVLLTDTG